MCIGNRVKKAKKLVETGRLGSAARVLAGDSKIIEVDDGVVQALRQLHPAGEVDPFGDTVGPSQGRAPGNDDIKAGICAFKPDTAPGISGWTVPLLRLAARSSRFVDFLTALTAGISANTAPGSSLLCASRLTPLTKATGGIRPIAVGELFYRLVAKVLQKHVFKTDFLAQYQLGVGSKGGVEPIVRGSGTGARGHTGSSILSCRQP